MKQTLQLVAAPVSYQPGGYVATAYSDRKQPTTRSLEIEVARLAGTWRVAVSWSCPDPVREVSGDPGLFSDAAALLAPTSDDAPWATMGAPGKPVEGILWRAAGNDLHRVSAEGLGTVTRQPVPDSWTAAADWQAGAWRVNFTLRGWSTLESVGQLGVAVWRGAEGERGGLKSVTPGWVQVSV